MSLELARWWVCAAYLYFALGIVLLPWWHFRGLRRIDAGAASGPWGFRILISPGLAALWPWLIARARNGNGRPRVEQNAHRRRVERRTHP